MSYLPVLTKADFTVRYAAGEFGNASPTWHSLEDYAEHGAVDGLIHLRNRVAAGETHYNLKHYEAYCKWERKENPNNWYASLMAPTELTLIQGEVIQGCYGSGRAGLDLYYSTVAKPMREALAEKAEQVSGIIARSLLEHYLDANSLEWLQVLLDRYPGHCVEISTYSKCWGTVPGFNTVFWECRQY